MIHTIRISLGNPHRTLVEQRDVNLDGSNASLKDTEYSCGWWNGERIFHVVVRLVDYRTVFHIQRADEI